MAGFRPLHDRVLLKRIEAEEKTAGGIIIPTRRKKNRPKARFWRSVRVLATRPGKLQPLDVKTGDRVLFGKWSGTEVILDGADRLIVKEADILGIFETVR